MMTFFSFIMFLLVLRVAPLLGLVPKTLWYLEVLTPYIVFNHTSDDFALTCSFVALLSMKRLTVLTVTSCLLSALLVLVLVLVLSQTVGIISLYYSNVLKIIAH